MPDLRFAFAGAQSVRAMADARFVTPTLSAVLFTFAMFWSMHKLVADGIYVPVSGEKLPSVSFDPLIKDTQLDPPPRPPKPVPPKQPPPPKIQVTVPTQEAPPMPIVVPRIDLPSGIRGGPVVEPGGDTQGYSELLPLVRIQPQYPRQAARDGLAGFVVFEVTINADGTVKSARAIKSQPRGVFEAAATQAIMKWKFKPKVVDGEAVEAKGTQQIDFRLEAE
jgi:protein TonB